MFGSAVTALRCCGRRPLPGSRLRGAFGLVNTSGQSATQPSNKPPCFRYLMKNGYCPSGVTAAVVSHSTVLASSSSTARPV